MRFLTLLTLLFSCSLVIAAPIPARPKELTKELMLGEWIWTSGVKESGLERHEPLILREDGTCTTITKDIVLVSVVYHGVWYVKEDKLYITWSRIVYNDGSESIDTREELIYKLDVSKYSTMTGLGRYDAQIGMRRK